MPFLVAAVRPSQRVLEDYYIDLLYSTRNDYERPECESLAVCPCLKASWGGIRIKACAYAFRVRGPKRYRLVPIDLRNRL